MPPVGKVETSEKMLSCEESSRTKLRVYLGIDPGASGGLVAWDSWEVVNAVPMSPTESDIWLWLRGVSGRFNLHGEWEGHDCQAIIEKVGGYVGDAGNPGSSMFKFGASYGGLRMALIAAGIPFEEVTPQAWQKAFGISPRKKKAGESKIQWKNRLKARAQQLFPNMKVTLATADALLIATYCKRKHEGTLER